MKQWLNGLVALCVALLLGGTILIGSQNPPPEARRLDPSPTVTPQPTASPLRPTAQGIADFPENRQGMLMATQPDGKLRIFRPTAIVSGC